MWCSQLSLDEFAIAMHLVTKRVAGEPLPSTGLPPSLLPPFEWEAAARVADSVAGVASHATPTASSARQVKDGGSDGSRWAMTLEERLKYEGVFVTVLRAGTLPCPALS